MGPWKKEIGTFQGKKAEAHNAVIEDQFGSEIIVARLGDGPWTLTCRDLQITQVRLGCNLIGMAKTEAIKLLRIKLRAMLHGLGERDK